MAVPGPLCHGLAFHCAGCYTNTKQRRCSLPQELLPQIIADRCELSLLWLKAIPLFTSSLPSHVCWGFHGPTYTRFLESAVSMQTGRINEFLCNQLISAAKSLLKTFAKAADQVLHADTGTQFIFSGSCGCEQQFVALPEEFQEGI